MSLGRIARRHSQTSRRASNHKRSRSDATLGRPASFYERTWYRGHHRSCLGQAGAGSEALQVRTQLFVVDGHHCARSQFRQYSGSRLGPTSREHLSKNATHSRRKISPAGGQTTGANTSTSVAYPNVGAVPGQTQHPQQSDGRSREQDGTREEPSGLNNKLTTATMRYASQRKSFFPQRRDTRHDDQHGSSVLPIRPMASLTP